VCRLLSYNNTRWGRRPKEEHTAGWGRRTQEEEQQQLGGGSVEEEEQGWERRP
jgi:hypothetical protein